MSRLTLIDDSGGRMKCRYRCVCGKEVTLYAGKVEGGHTKSCGCLKVEDFRRRSTKHGQRGHPLYEVWVKMRERCRNPNCADYPKYGGRGISVAAEWEDFPTFVRDVGHRPAPGMSLDREDNDGDYRPGNVRWATPKQQANNSRKVRNITVAGVTHNLTEWAKEIGVSVSSLHNKLKLQPDYLEHAVKANSGA